MEVSEGELRAIVQMHMWRGRGFPAYDALPCKVSGRVPWPWPWQWVKCVVSILEVNTGQGQWKLVGHDHVPAIVPGILLDQVPTAP